MGSCSGTGILILIQLLSITWADSIRPLNPTESSEPSDRVDLPDPSRTDEQQPEDPYYNFLKINPSQPPTETSEQHHSAPSVAEQSNPVDAPPSYPAAPAAHDQTVQQETAVVDDPLYDFLKNILPQVPAQVTEPESPSVPASSDPANPSYPAEHVQQTTKLDNFADKEFFLNIGPPPKPRALGFPQITNTRENVVQQNNWAIV